MNRTPVQSSHIRSAAWDALNKTLEVEYANGDVGVYQGVPRYLYDGLVGSPSKGAYLHTHVKGKFPYRKKE